MLYSPFFLYKFYGERRKNMSNNKLAFIPVQGPENKILNNENHPKEGHIYFTTDTKKIFLGKNDKFIPICEKNAFFYGNKDVGWDNSGAIPPKDQIFSIDKKEIEGNDIPEKNDLILNTDGCFYKVISVNDALEITTTRLTLQGSGGGGGGSAGGSSQYNIKVTPEVNIFSSKDEKMFIYFQGIAEIETEVYIDRISLTIGQEESDTVTPFYIEENKRYEIGTIKNPKLYPIDISKYKDLFGYSQTTLYLNTTDIYGVNRSKKFSIQIVDLSLTEYEKVIFKSTEDIYNYSCIVGGAKTGINNKKLIMSIYSEDNLKTPIIDPQEIIVDTSYNGTKICSLDLTNLPHGVYVLKVQMQANITGSEKFIYSNILTHKLIRFIPDSSTEALLAVNIPDHIEQYTNIPINFMIASDEDNKTYTVKISLDGQSKIDLVTTTNTLKTYTLYFENKGNYILNILVNEMSNLSQTFLIQVIEYTGNLPIINPTDPALMLYLTPKGRSNDAIDRDSWTDYNGKYIATLSNMYYSDNSGWLKENGTDYLQLTSGSILTIPKSMTTPAFRPFAEDPTVSSNTNSAMGKGMTIEIDFMIDSVTDYDAELIKCISKDQNNSISVGFVITGKKIQFYNSSKNGGDAGSLVNINLIEGKRIRLSFVIEPNDSYHPYPMCLTYLNGKISGAAIYSKQDSFIDSTDGPAELIIDSSQAQIKIYSIRFYTNALNDNEILNNYTASLPTLEERQNRFNSNNVYNEENEINYEDIIAESYDLQIPYMTIIGGWACNPDDKWEMLPADKIGDAALPTGKKDYRMIDVSVKYPKNEYFKNYKDYSYKNIFENGLGMMDNFGNKPINKTGCIMYAQGTSSMEYPVKNLRLRFRNQNNYYTVRPDIAPVEIICMKADYMESSGSHNTGAANLVDDLYKGASLASPGQKHFGPTEAEPDKKTIITCIKGHPCLIFWSPDGSKGSFKYVGKYNLNLDKATPEPFGFNHDDSDFGYLKPGDKYYAVQYDDDGDKFIGQMNPENGGDYDDTKEGEELKTVLEGEKVNSIHCFEFLDNAVPVCNFLRRPKAYIKDEGGNLVPDPTGGYYTYEETWYNGFEDDGDILPGWTFGFESRYPEDRVGYHDADMLYPLASWLSELYYLKTEGSNGSGTPTQNDIDLANARFKNEYQAYFNKDFLLFYYIVTEALLMTDSRVKNMMIATWGKEEPFSYYPLAFKENIQYIYAGTVNMVDWSSGKTYYKLEEGEYVIASAEDEEHTILYTQKLVQSWTPDTTQSAIVTTNYKWYPIFYDMDTMLGLDNTGVNRFNYYDEDYDPSTYNGDEILWNFVRDNLTLELNSMYNKLEPAGLNIDLNKQGDYVGTSVIPYFNNNQANMANEAFYNGDAQYKYIRPAVEGYWDGLNNVQINPGEAPYLYAAQGDRSLDREYFLTNRIKFLRGKHGSDDFKTNDRITFRLYYPTGQEANFKETVTNPDGTTSIIDHSNSVSEGVAPPSDTFTFESLQTCYAGVLIGANGRVVKERFDGEEKKAIKVQEAQSANGTEAYLLGISGLKDLGDLSDKYPQKFIMSGKNKLRSLTLGNPHKEYYNPFWRPAEGNSTPIGLSGCTYLQSFNLQNCKTYNATIDFSSCPVIETILLTGSSTSNLVLPINGVIKELRLPTSITNLSINSHQYLIKENFSIGTYNYGDDNLIGGNGEYLNDYTNLKNITIINTPIDTYEMVSKASNLNSYYFEGFNWIIKGEENDTQYLTTNDDEWDETKTYYIWDIANKKYTIATETDFNNFHSRIKEQYTLKNDEGEIIRIPILDYLNTKIPQKDSTSVTRESALTGTITLKVPAKVNQFKLYQKYHKMYPNVILDYDEETIGKDNLIKAFKIQFFNIPLIDEDENIPDLTNEEPYYSVLTDGKFTLSELTSKEGPSGSSLIRPTKQPTNYKKYIFTGKWKDITSGEIYDMDKENWTTIKPAQNLNLVPIFNSEIRYYTINFYDYSTEDKPLFSINRQYDNTIENEEELNIQAYYLYKELNSDYERWGFKGWQTEKDYNNNAEEPSLVNLTETKISSLLQGNVDELNLYAYYKIENVNESVTMRESEDDYFSFSNYGDGYAISIIDKYRNILKGKITLPIYYKNSPIYILDDFQNLEYVTEIYFINKDESKYTDIGNPNGKTGFNCRRLTELNKRGSLTKIELPETIININEEAFTDNFNLTTINLPSKLTTLGKRCFGFSDTFDVKNNKLQVMISQLPETVSEIGSHAFYNAGPYVKISQLPPNLTTLNEYSFAGCENLQIQDFGFLSKSSLTIKHNSLRQSGKTITEIYVGPNVTIEGKNESNILQPGGFNEYGSTTTTNCLVYFDKDSPYSKDDTELSLLGFSNNWQKGATE